MSNPNEIWQTDLGGQIFEKTFEELTHWIADGTLLPQDKIRRGNLRWIEAGKVPSLYGFFNAQELGISPPSINIPPPSPNFGQNQVTQTLHVNNSNGPFGTGMTNNFCVLHSNSKAAFLCEVCANYFCQDCPQSPGKTTVSCPMCGANCQILCPPVQPAFQIPTPAPAVSFDPKPPIERPTSFPTPKLPVTNSVNEFKDQTKSSGVGIFLLIVIALLLSGPIAYLWAYQISAPDEEAEKKLPKIVALEEKLNTEKAEEDRKWHEAQRAAKLKREAEAALQQSNLTSGGSGGSSGCFEGMTNNPVPCDPSLDKFRDSMSEKYKDMQAGFQPVMPNLDQFTQNFRPPSMAQEEFTKEKKKVIEQHRQGSSKQQFLLTFIGSFVVLFGLLLIKRKLSSK